MDKKIISLLGSTGSIGTQTLDVAKSLGLPVSTLAANRNIDLLERQIREFRPKTACVYDEEKASELKNRVKDLPVKVLSGMDGLCACAADYDADIVLTAVSGMIGFLPTVEAIKAKKTIALANKETLVAGGSVVTALAREKGVQILPVDSEHSAVFQSLLGCKDRKREVKRIILTASGGPFFGRDREFLKSVKPADALKHPNWSMGSKITIDSATLMNKGLEVIEAMWLFDVPLSKIEVVVHRESIIHSMVEYTDNAVIAELGEPDMKIPIQLAITYPERYECDVKPLDFTSLKPLTFAKPDIDAFRCLPLCIRAAEIGGTMPAAVNAANEIAVGLFLREKIGFLDIEKIIAKILNLHKMVKNPTADDIIKVDGDIREYVSENYASVITEG
ncbi:MAG: 1-deoxy-D-xylulose-5-phosphate reductoisomerase [Bacillota bacterium]|nr:1-deoxy-D-xylulose-5-phosphate reductoisomerase [Bacillota bacterium]